MENEIIVDGIITSSDNNEFEGDDEYTEFHIKYDFEYNAVSYSGIYDFIINTIHVSYAHAGQLYGFPKADFTVKDIFNVLKKGTKIKVYFQQNNPENNMPEFDEIIYVAAKF